MEGGGKSIFEGTIVAFETLRETITNSYRDIR